MPGQGSWFDAFERNLAKNGWLDWMDQDDLYEKAAKDAFDEIADRDAPEKEEE